MTRPLSEGRDVGQGLDDLAHRYELTGHQTDQLRRVLSELEIDENAPTTVRRGVAALDMHVADSLVALELGFMREARRVVDLGAGAGFPGIVLAIALPESAVQLVESQARKCAFIETLAGAAGVDNAEVVNARAEDWVQGVGEHDLITARALAAQEVVLEYAAPLLGIGGRLVDWRGRRDPATEALALAAGQELGMACLEVRPVEPYPAARDLHLHVFEKVAPTPPRFPRRAGIARKRPLGH